MWSRVYTSCILYEQNLNQPDNVQCKLPILNLIEIRFGDETYGRANMPLHYLLIQFVRIRQIFERCCLLIKI
jgi:hypothetical protein